MRRHRHEGGEGAGEGIFAARRDGGRDPARSCNRHNRQPHHTGGALHGVEGDPRCRQACLFGKAFRAFRARRARPEAARGKARASRRLRARHLPRRGAPVGAPSHRRRQGRQDHQRHLPRHEPWHGALAPESGFLLQGRWRSDPRSRLWSGRARRSASTRGAQRRRAGSRAEHGRGSATDHRPGRELRLRRRRCGGPALRLGVVRGRRHDGGARVRARGAAGARRDPARVATGRCSRRAPPATPRSPGTGPTSTTCWWRCGPPCPPAPGCAPAPRPPRCADELPDGRGAGVWCPSCGAPSSLLAAAGPTKPVPRRGVRRAG